MAQFEKGNPGKPKGAQNKLTKTVKDTVLAVFNDIQEDPKVNLTAFAKAYPRDFYNIASRLIPTEVNASVTTKLIKVIAPGESDEEEEDV